MKPDLVRPAVSREGLARAWWRGLVLVAAVSVLLEGVDVGVIVLMAFGFLLVYRVVDRRRAHGTPVGGGG